MNIRELGLAAGAAIALATEPAPPAKPLQVERFGLYVAADDVANAARFYERLFVLHPQRATPTFVGFDVKGALFAVVSWKAFRLQTERGGRVRPYIRVADIDAAFEHARAVAPQRLESRSVVNEGPFRFFRIADPEGNVVEFFNVASLPPP